MVVLSLFDGISCGQVALERAGIKVSKYYASEIDKHAIKVTQHNYPNTIQLGDIKNWREWDIEKPDLIMGGSPCQGFSVNGKMLNFKDPRSKLFFVFLDIKNFYSPKYWLLENVATMKKDIKSQIDNHIGVKGVYINSNIVSAQNRKRFYWTNIKLEHCFSKSDIVLSDILEDVVDEDMYMEDSFIRAQKVCPSKTSGVITLNPKTKSGRQTYQQDRVYHYSGRMVALTAGLGNRFRILDKHDRIRKLTVREQARLQTIPDCYELSCVTDWQASRLLGNGWTVDVIAHIFKGINNA